MKKFKSVMQYTKSFYIENEVLSKLSLVSFAFIVFYYISYDMPELWKNASVLVNILFQFSLAIVSSLIFYIVQIYIPDYNRKKKFNQSFAKKSEGLLK